MSFIARRAFPLLAALLAFGSAGGIADAGPFTVLESGPAGVVLEYRSAEPSFETVDTPNGVFQHVTMPGHLETQDPGEPALPITGAGLAIPDGTRARMTFEILESATFEGLRPLPAGAAAVEPAPSIDAGRGVFPAEPITFRDLGRLRHHRVGQVSVRPLQFDSGAGSLTRIVRAVIRVRFERDPAALSASGPSLPVGPEPAWEDTYRRAFLNYEAARLFRSRPAPQATAEKARAAAAGGGGQTEFRVYVEKTGIYTITFSRLSAAGWPDGIPVDQIRYYERRLNNANPSQPIERDIPIRVEEGETGTAGIFDGDDVFYVYGQGFRDRFHPRVADARYTNLHTYWVSWSETGGVRMSLVSGWHEADTFARPVSFFQWTHYEEDRSYIYYPLTEGAGPGEPPPVDTHYWLPPGTHVDSLSFDSFGRDPGTKARIRADWLGTTGFAHYITMWLTRNCAAPEDTLLLRFPQFGGESRYVYDSGLTLPAGRFADGCNRLKIQANGSNGNPENPGSGAAFNSFDVGYFRRYEARDSRLRFTTGDATGDVELEIRGLRQPALYVFDVTDSLNPAFVDLSGAEIMQLSPPPSPEYRLRFRTVATSLRTFEIYTAASLPDLGEAVPPGHFPPAVTNAVLVRDDGEDAAADVDADVLLISPPQFREEAQRLADHRESQGHRVRILSPQDIWNQFSGGDKSVPAFRAWLRWAFREWNRAPEYVLFFGDASEDYRNTLTTSKPDWVSTWMAFAPETLGGQQELISNDNYFVGPLATGDNDSNLLPDMHAGRLSVGSVGEARDIVDKLIAYDDYGPDDAWRNRGLIVSDDFYSNPLRGLESYRYRQENRAFQRGADSIRVELNRGSCLGDFSLEEFRISDTLDTLQAIPRTFVDTDFPDLAATREYTISNLRPQWLSTSARGHLFQFYAGHGNRTVMTSENLIQFVGRFVDPDDRTVEQLANHGRPFIFIGIACHLNQFHSYDEKIFQYSIAERMVLLPRAGAIASIASSGFESTPNSVFVEQALARSLFADLPLDPDTERPRRILGEGKDLAILTLAIQNNQFQKLFQSYLLLGDPTMPIDMAPPRVTVTAAGGAVSPGALVTAEPSGSTLRITARVSDDVANGAFSIRDDSTAVSPDRLTVTPVLDGRCPASLVSYTADVKPASYAIVLTASDWLGRPLEFPLNVRLDVEYRVNGVLLEAGQEAPLDGDYEVRILSPAPLGAERLEILVNGEGGYFTPAAVDGGNRVFTATNLRELPGGPVRFLTRIDGVTARSAGAELDVTVQTEVSVREVYFYPNPWEGGGAAFFTYQLSYRQAERPSRATVSVFTVSGRKLASLEAPVELGRNRLDWNVRDREGDEIANGVYLWKLTIESADGPPLSRIERLVVHR